MKILKGIITGVAVCGWIFVLLFVWCTKDLTDNLGMDLDEEWDAFMLVDGGGESCE